MTNMAIPSEYLMEYSGGSGDSVGAGWMYVPNPAYTAYVEQQKLQSQQMNKGDPNTPGTIAYLEKNIAASEGNQRESFQRALNAMIAAGVSNVMDLPYETRASLPGATPETPYSSTWDTFVPMLATLAGGYAAASGLGAMGAGGASSGAAAGAGAAGYGAAYEGLGGLAASGGAAGAAAGTGAAAGGAAGSGVTVGSAAGAGSPTVIGTATGSGQFVNAAGQAIPAAAGAGAGAAPALASGTTTGGTFTPAVQGATTGGTAAAGVGGATALQRILSGNGTDADYLSVIGQVAPSLLSAYGSSQQADDYKELADKYMAMGAPYRDELARISADPNAFYTSPTATKATEAVLQRLSSQYGNPAGNPYAQSLTIDALYDKYGSERDRLAGYGGLTQYNAAAPGAAGTAINAEGSVYGDIGYGIGNVMNPQQQTLAQLLRQYGVQGGSV